MKARRRDVLPTDRIADWLRDLSIPQQEKLIALDLARPEWCSALAAKNDSDLQRHLGAFEAWLTDSRTRRGHVRSASHIGHTIQQVQNIIDGCGFHCWADIKRAAVESFLGTLKKTPRKPGQAPTEGVSTKTYNEFLGSFKHFCKWVVEDGRAEFSPVQYSKPWRLPGRSGGPWASMRNATSMRCSGSSRARPGRRCRAV